MTEICCSMFVEYYTVTNKLFLFFVVKAAEVSGSLFGATGDKYFTLANASIGRS